jgi:translation initiation factor IF-3
VPVPRRFDRRPPERDSTRINERIRVPEVRLIDEHGDQVGVMKTDAALRYAQDRDLDLVEVAPEARPPVCRVLDYSKYKYEQAQKLKQARKHQQQITIREIKFRPKIAENDYNTKKGHVERFLRHKDKVKITIMFRGREVTHPERGVMILDRLAEELAELATIEQRPLQDGRNMTMMLGPSKAVLSGEIGGGDKPAAEAAKPAQPGDASSRPLGGGGGDALAPRPPAAAPGSGSDAGVAPAGGRSGAARAADRPADAPRGATANGDSRAGAVADTSDAPAPSA